MPRASERYGPSKRGCAEMASDLTNYLEGAMGLDDRARFERHLSGCPSCRRALDEMRRTIALLGNLDPAALPDEITRSPERFASGNRRPKPDPG